MSLTWDIPTNSRLSPGGDRKCTLQYPKCFRYLKREVKKSYLRVTAADRDEILLIQKS